MKISLHVSTIDNVKDYSLGRRFRFAVVDLDKPSGYPSNFICMLPAHFGGKGESRSVFTQIFGDKSLEQAKALLSQALKTEQDSEVKAEIERRLNLLEPKPLKQIKCSGCGKLFQARRVRRYSQNFCEECLARKFGSRE